MLTIVLNFVLPVALYVIVLRASQAHDDAIRRASYVAHNAVSVNDALPPPSPPPLPQARTFYGRIFGLLSPSTVDRRLEALSAAHTGDAQEPHARMSRLLDVKAPPDSPGADPQSGGDDDALYGHHAGDPLRTAAPSAPSHSPTPSASSPSSSTSSRSRCRLTGSPEARRAGGGRRDLVR